MKPNTSLLCLGVFLSGATALKPRALASDSVLLTEEDIGDFSAIAFGDETAVLSDPTPSVPCKIFPDDNAWPPETEWAQLNETLSGALLKPKPAAGACYQGPDFDLQQCQFLLANASMTHFWLDDPLVALSEWSQGRTCTLATNPEGNCTRGGFPEYVVNATSVKDIQAAVNFARNNNIRLVIKNTGHDFGGRSVGAGSLSIWTHWLKEMEFIPTYRIGQYRGMAAQLGAGVESWETHNFMVTHNITVVAPGYATVGGVGGWMSNGGHTYITSKLGLGADQVLSLGVVTASGRYVTADPFTNSDLFFAIRGGGGATYGVVTSAIFKAHPQVYVTNSALNLMLVPPSDTTFPQPNLVTDPEIFWQGVGAYYRYLADVLDAGGYGFSYIYPMGNNSFTFTTTTRFVDFTQEAAAEFMVPLYDELRAIGLNVTNPSMVFTGPYATPRSGGASPPSNTRYRSRLLPRENWEDDALWNQTMRAIRTATEAGFDNDFYFHGTLASPTAEVAGWPGRDNAINPAWRNNRMHAMLMDQTPSQSAERDAMFSSYMDLFRAAAPNAGSYMNEGDPAEPNWQQAFYGTNYERLRRIKSERDPWGLFWAPTTPGSEAWAVSPVDGVSVSQNGRLCRT
ncbi:FAD-binding domain-containing protein [Hypoxylon rubiginosum]|uniref:FAD-binding domain-containing protein n=1 Tax=Hypoxylon rubiginosum TaxID=110542 RepID=A0ACB9YP76_9PEZI|nr:FAD-binding domain-containing protein [Hypoxylon rubiginosum]